MSDIADPHAWVARAEEDHTVACASFRRKKPLVNAACFHAQQCAEKYLKALLVSQGRAFAKTHDLLVLSEACAEAGIHVPVSEDKLSILSSCAVRVRYPGPEPTPAETAEAVEIAKAVRKFARATLGR
jgi:HEPN domain-containing protein